MYSSKGHSKGQKLIQKINSGEITFDSPTVHHQHGLTGGYAELYYDAFQCYLSSCGHYLMDKKLKNIPYRG